MTTKSKLNSIFEKYFSQQAVRKKAITPSQKKELIERLRLELSQDGRIPSLTGPIRLDINNPVVKAAISTTQ